MMPLTRPLDFGNHRIATPRGGVYAKAVPRPIMVPYVMAVATTEYLGEKKKNQEILEIPVGNFDKN